MVARTWNYIKRNHLEISLSLLCLFLLLWNLDRYFHICPYGVIPGIIAVIFEIYIHIEHKLKHK
jgi:hypothetical protein